MNVDFSESELRLLDLILRARALRYERMRDMRKEAEKEKELELRKWCVERSNTADSKEAIKIYEFLSASRENMLLEQPKKSRRMVHVDFSDPDLWAQTKKNKKKQTSRRKGKK